MGYFNDEEEDDGLPSANASGILDPGVTRWLNDKFGTPNDEDIDPGMKRFLDDKFNNSEL